ncbi:hypothetical protein ABIE45_003456 [Methylobacterium sp. OAE515]
MRFRSITGLGSSENAVTLHFWQPGKPAGNAMVESINGCLDDERLNANWFLPSAGARSKIGI